MDEEERDRIRKRQIDRLGHKDDETTTQVYLHITKEKQKKGFSKVWSTNEKPSTAR